MMSSPGMSVQARSNGSPLDVDAGRRADGAAPRAGRSGAAAREGRSHLAHVAG